MSDETQNLPWLEATDGRCTRIDGTCYLGRSSSNTLMLSDEKASRRHAMIHMQEEGEYWLVDLGSSNGTYVNGRRLTQPTPLSDGDRIEIGASRFIFRRSELGENADLGLCDAAKTIQDIRSVDCWLLVADIESSTQFIQNLPPEEVPKATANWLLACRQIVETHAGAINKFLGDGFLAYWMGQENDAGRVAEAIQALRVLQDQQQPRFRLALHFGTIFLGGGASLGEESLLGPEVNFVFRMEKLAASVGQNCLISEPAQKRLAACLSTVPAGSLEVPSFTGQYPFYALP